MRFLCVLLAAQLALLQGSGVHGVQRTHDDVDGTPETVPSETSSVAQGVPSGASLPLSVMEKLPKQLAAHYSQKGLDNVVYFSFCIA